MLELASFSGSSDKISSWFVTAKMLHKQPACIMVEGIFDIATSLYNDGGYIYLIKQPAYIIMEGIFERNKILLIKVSKTFNWAKGLMVNKVLEALHMLT